MPKITSSHTDAIGCDCPKCKPVDPYNGTIECLVDETLLRLTWAYFYASAAISLKRHRGLTRSPRRTPRVTEFTLNAIRNFSHARLR